MVNIIEIVDRPSIKFIFVLLLSCLWFMLGYSYPFSKPCHDLEWIEAVNFTLPDRIKENQIHVFNARTVIDGNYGWSSFTNTDSMLPLLDKGSNGLFLNVTDTTQLFVGDVVAYEYGDGTDRRVHRIINVDYDYEGIYYIIKGDNVREPDPGKIRREQIKRVLVGVIW